MKKKESKMKIMNMIELMNSQREDCWKNINNKKL